GGLEGMHHTGETEFINMVGFQMGQLQRRMRAVPIGHRKIFRQQRGAVFNPMGVGGAGMFGALGEVARHETEAFGRGFFGRIAHGFG
ncbi:hypothetical protein HMPREF9370_0429, partial [Neisseria wadsworthii 9715]